MGIDRRLEGCSSGVDRQRKRTGPPAILEYIVAGGKRAGEVIRLGAEERRALRKRHLFESRRLPGCRQNGLPPKAIGVDLLLL